MTRARVDGCSSAAEHHALWEELDALAAYCDSNLSLVRDPGAPMLWAVWLRGDVGDEDLIGAGDAASEAIEEARKQLRAWRERA